MSKHVREKCAKLCISSIQKVPKGAKLLQELTKIDDTRIWTEVNWMKVIYNISAQYVKACRRKVRKTAYFQYSKFQKGHNSYKNWRKLTTLAFDLKLIEWKSYTTFQLNMSKHVGERCGKLRISSILSSKRGHNFYKNWRELTTIKLDM